MGGVDGRRPTLADHVTDLLFRLEREQAGALDQASQLLWEAVTAGRLVHVGGAGHSIGLVLETFYRAGGLACVNPVWHPALLPLFGGPTSTQLERIPGLGVALVSQAGVRSGDVLVIFSNSGINAVPVDMAIAGRDAGARVVAVVSLDHARSVPSRHPTGQKLPDVADLTIDTGAPLGDASYRTGPDAPPTAPLSTILGAYVWNALLVRLAERAAEAGVALPVWRSANLPGYPDDSTELVGRYRGRVVGL